jgi:hypothetical protein
MANGSAGVTQNCIIPGQSKNSEEMMIASAPG